MIEYDFVEMNKQKILEDNNYIIDDRDFYISKADKKVFSFSRVSNESIAWLEQEIKQPNSTDEWQFFCNDYHIFKVYRARNIILGIRTIA